MPLRFVLDEHLRGGALWKAIQQHNSAGIDPIDVIRVGDPNDLPNGSTDPEVLRWSWLNDRILVSLDRRTLPAHLAIHVQTNGRSPGVLIVRPGSMTSRVLFSLVLIAHAGDSADYQDRIEYIP